MVKATATQTATFSATLMKRDHPVGEVALLDALLGFRGEVARGTGGVIACEAVVVEGEVGCELDGVVDAAGAAAET
jgi:hypothetical protein